MAKTSRPLDPADRARLVDKLVTQVNIELDFPFVSEEQEAEILEWIFVRIAAVLPMSLLKFMLDASDGLDAEEINRHTDLLVAYLNSQIDFPGLSEGIEERVLRVVVRQTFELARSGSSLL